MFWDQAVLSSLPMPYDRPMGLPRGADACDPLCLSHRTLDSDAPWYGPSRPAAVLQCYKYYASYIPYRYRSGQHFADFTLRRYRALPPAYIPPHVPAHAPKLLVSQPVVFLAVDQRHCVSRRNEDSERVAGSYSTGTEGTLPP